MAYFILYVVIVIALGITGLFFYGLWKVLRTTTLKKTPQHLYKKNIFTLSRHDNNPLLSPSSHSFEKEAVFNAAAAHDGDSTHLFYRALGEDGVSRIGYAQSGDGITVDERLPYPVYALEGLDPSLVAARRAYMAEHYAELLASGGSWGGTEDPRAVIIDDRLYLSFSAFQSWNSVRIGITSIALDDLRAKRWKWAPLAFLSPNSQVNKNWVLFPQKFAGNFAIMHSISPDIKIDYRADLRAVGTREPYIESPQGARSKGRLGHWDNWVRGAGASPLKTAKGWLLFYHATNRETHSNEYQIGAMLLDTNNPSRVLARASAPVLSPEASYEVNGAKPGVVYTCGATTHSDELTVYYGAADNYLCAARTSLSEFLAKMLYHQPSDMVARA